MVIDSSDAVIRQYIIEAVEAYLFTKQEAILSTLEATFVSRKMDDFLKILSELVQANEIKRYEYTIENRAERRVFYMPASARLMF